MSAFEPGDGWREAELGRDGTPGTEHVMWNDGRVLRKLWVRDEPVPPLPTEPYTVIRVTVKDWGVVDWWRDLRGNWRFLTDGDLVPSIDITGFEVLAEPTPRVALYEEQQRVARDVLHAIRDTWNEVLESDEVTITGERWRAICKQYRVDT